jgi:DedD protein
MARSISDEELQLKVRARRRILGAVAIVVALVVLLPMVLDSQPKREVQEVAINIPAQDKAPPFNPSLKPVEPVAKAAADMKPTQRDEAATDVAKPAPTESRPPAELKPLDQPTSDKANTAEATMPADMAKPAEGKSGKFAVQLGVFSNPDNAGQVETKLKENKIRHYTETLKSPPGAIRVRAGPYTTRADAESALTRLKLAGIGGGVVVSE